MHGRASARRPGFLPEIVKIIADCRRICQDRGDMAYKLTKKESNEGGFSPSVYILLQEA